MKPVRLTGAGLTWIGLTILVAFALVVGLGGYYAGRRPPASQSASVMGAPGNAAACSNLSQAVDGLAVVLEAWKRAAGENAKENARLRARLVLFEHNEALDRTYRRYLHAEGLTDRIEHVPAR